MMHKQETYISFSVKEVLNALGIQGKVTKFTIKRRSGHELLEKVDDYQVNIVIEGDCQIEKPQLYIPLGWINEWDNEEDDYWDKMVR